MTDQELGVATGLTARPQPEAGVTHTPGPWIDLQTGFGSARFLVCRDLPGRIHPVCVMEEGSPNAEADARLISAAPDLLKALKGVREACFYAEDDGQIGVTMEPTLYEQQFDAICAAIAKATGASPSLGDSQS